MGELLVAITVGAAVMAGVRDRPALVRAGDGGEPGCCEAGAQGVVRRVAHPWAGTSNRYSALPTPTVVVFGDVPLL